MTMHQKITWALVVLLTLGIGVGLAQQWQTTALLRIEWDALREQKREWVKVRADNDRLKRERPAPAEVERMRADHAAMVQLRSELEALWANAPGR